MVQPTEYQCLVQAFSPSMKHEIEVLPSSFPIDERAPIMIDGNCLGIPKKILVKAFLQARAQFMSGLTQKSILDPALSNASRVILLFDTEFLTAANFRKRRVEAVRDESPERLGQVIQEELFFLDSLLTSPLHRQSKSPTLWFHRRWVLKFETNRGITPLALVKRELDAVTVSGERHAMNYYAWQYARKLFADSTSIEEQAMIDVAERIQVWCLAHPSDSSAWSFLEYLLTKLPNPSSFHNIVEAVLEFAEQTNWRKEALLTFLRNVGKDKHFLVHNSNETLHKSLLRYIEEKQVEQKQS